MALAGGCIRRFISDEDSGGSGQALAEFAIVFPFQLFITFGLIQIMLLLVSALMVNYAAFMACRSEMVGENGKEAAAIILSPLAYHRIPGGTDENKSIPGWGGLHGSGAALGKIEYDSTEKGDIVEVHLTFKQELVCPFVDRLFLFFGSGSSDGRNFAGASEANGRVQMLGGRVHVLITRSHYIRRDSEIDVAADSDVYDFEWN